MMPVATTTLNARQNCVSSHFTFKFITNYDKLECQAFVRG